MLRVYTTVALLVGLAALCSGLLGCGGKPGNPPGKPADEGKRAQPATVGAGATAARPPEAKPEWFTLEYRMITHFPTCRGNTRVKVDRDGKVWSMRSDKDCPRGVDFSAPYPGTPKAELTARERARMLDLIVKGGFFDLKPPGRGDVLDGYREEIEVSLPGRQRTVVVHNGTKLDGWNQLKAAVIRYTQ